MDGADLLGLCGDNLVFDCDLGTGIRQGNLVPFDYWGMRDATDFEPNEVWTTTAGQARWAP